jgi:hypothetical protein
MKKRIAWVAKIILSYRILFVRITALQEPTKIKIKEPVQNVTLTVQIVLGQIMISVKAVLRVISSKIQLVISFVQMDIIEINIHQSVSNVKVLATLVQTKLIVHLVLKVCI